LRQRQGAQAWFFPQLAEINVKMYVFNEETWKK